MDSIPYLLIGGYAAVHAARAIRARDGAGRVMLLNAEAHAPYERPPLSKQLLFETDYAADETRAETPQFYADHKIELRLNARATKIDRAARTVTLASGEQLGYEKLLLAPGSGAKKPGFEGGDLAGVHVLRTLDDSLQLRAAFGEAERVAIVGGSYLGLEVASGARKRGVAATVIDSNGGPWSKFAADDLQGFVRGRFEDAGVEFVFDQEVERINGRERVESVQTASGPIECDLLVAAIGAQLNTELAEGAGLELDAKHGIVVDEGLRTADENIWVAGDCAAYPEAFVGQRWHNEHYRNAQWQGEVAGANMAGDAQKFARAPYFFSDFLDLHMTLRGNPAGGKAARVLGAMAAGEFVQLYADDAGVVKMAVTISHDKAKTRAIAETLEPLLWDERRVGEYSAELVGL